jgi:hypothetical protein
VGILLSRLAIVDVVIVALVHLLQNPNGLLELLCQLLIRQLLREGDVQGVGNDRVLFAERVLPVAIIDGEG